MSNHRNACPPPGLLTPVLAGAWTVAFGTAVVLIIASVATDSAPLMVAGFAAASVGVLVSVVEVVRARRHGDRLTAREVR